jgi:hypothetical protein
VAGASGTYFYWAATSADTPLPQRPGLDSQLSGAIVVDPRDGPVQLDRIFVIGLWSNSSTPALASGASS